MTFVQLIQGGALFAMRRCRINLYPVGIEARTKVPCKSARAQGSKEGWDPSIGRRIAASRRTGHTSHLGIS